MSTPRARLLLLLLVVAAASAACFAPGAAAGRPVAAGPAHLSQAAPAVAGIVYDDANANAVRDPSEAGLAGWTVFVDLHSTGVLSPDDPQTATGPDGSYSIASVPAGTYPVLLVQHSGYSCTMGCLYAGTFPTAQTITADFGESAAALLNPTSNVPPPALGKTFTARVVSGVILIKLPAGARSRAVRALVKRPGFVALTQRRSLPVGTTLDATSGSAQITTAVNTAGLTQTGVFGGATFKVLQNRRQRGLTRLNVILGTSARACPPVGAARTAAKRRLLPSSVLGRLRANAKGSFRTRGRFSAATVRGTSWDTIDRCDGTLTIVHRGTVVVRDVRRRISVILTAGRSYLAKAH